MALNQTNKDLLESDGGVSESAPGGDTGPGSGGTHRRQRYEAETAAGIASEVVTVDSLVTIISATVSEPGALGTILGSRCKMYCPGPCTDSSLLYFLPPAAQAHLAWPSSSSSFLDECLEAYHSLLQRISQDAVHQVTCTLLLRSAGIQGGGTGSPSASEEAEPQPGELPHSGVLGLTLEACEQVSVPAVPYFMTLPTNKCPDKEYCLCPPTISPFPVGQVLLGLTGQQLVEVVDALATSSYSAPSSWEQEVYRATRHGSRMRDMDGPLLARELEAEQGLKRLLSGYITTHCD